VGTDDTSQVPLGSASLARRLGAANGAGMADCARCWAADHPESDLIGVELAGGWIIAGDGVSPLARAVGLGLGAPLDDQSLDTLESIFIERGQKPRIDVSAYADPALMKTLAERGYKPSEFKGVNARRLGPNDPIDHASPGEGAEGVEITRVDRHDQDTVDRLVDVMSRAFNPDPPDWLVRVTRQGVKQPSAEVFAARVDGDLAGGGCLCVVDKVGMLYSGGVLERHRRRGVQSALIRGRLMWARDRGADVAGITSIPGGPTERNARRAGFSLVDTQIVMTREDT